MASYWSRRFRKSSGTIITVTIIGALICFAMAHLILMATDEEEDVNRRRREQVLVCTVLSLVPKMINILKHFSARMFMVGTYVGR